MKADGAVGNIASSQQLQQQQQELRRRQQRQLQQQLQQQMQQQKQQQQQQQRRRQEPFAESLAYDHGELQSLGERPARRRSPRRRGGNNEAAGNEGKILLNLIDTITSICSQPAQHCVNRMCNPTTCVDNDTANETIRQLGLQLPANLRPYNEPCKSPPRKGAGERQQKQARAMCLDQTNRQHQSSGGGNENCIVLPNACAQPLQLQHQGSLASSLCYSRSKSTTTDSILTTMEYGTIAAVYRNNTLVPVVVSPIHSSAQTSTASNTCGGTGISVLSPHGSSPPLQLSQHFFRPVSHDEEDEDYNNNDNNSLQFHDEEVREGVYDGDNDDDDERSDGDELSQEVRMYNKPYEASTADSTGVGSFSQYQEDEYAFLVS